MNYQIVEGIWEESGASPEFLAGMRLALLNQEGAPENQARWSSLPGLCCQGAGGDPGQAEEVTVAWSLLYDAAHLLDSIQDLDELDPRLQELGLAAAINIASGIVISGLSIVNQLYHKSESSQVARDICTRFYQVGIQMSGGQHRDLVTEQPGIAEWFEIAEAKSGTFFGLACWAGARLGTGDPERLASFYRFGSHLGVLLQIHDDLADLGELKSGDKKEKYKSFTRSLPVVYAMEVCPDEARRGLLLNLNEGLLRKGTKQDLINLLDQIGAGLYLRVEIERRQAMARDAMESARPEPSVRDELLSFIYRFEKENQTA